MKLFIKEFSVILVSLFWLTPEALYLKFPFKSASVNIIDGETGVSPGQACVFYSKDDVGDKLLGGGWIYKTLNKNLST